MSTNVVSELPGYGRAQREAEACLRGEEGTKGTLEEGGLATVSWMQYSSPEELGLQSYRSMYSSAFYSFIPTDLAYSVVHRAVTRKD